MNEDQKKWLLNLQSKGVKFEYCNINDEWVTDGKCTFSASQKKYRIPAQSIPDIPDWRELCMEMQSKGVRFEMQDYDREWVKWRNGFSFSTAPITKFRIPQQSLPEWREAMTEEKIFGNLRITDADLLEKIDQYMKDHPDSVVPVDEAQIARITELVKDVKIDEETKPDQREEIHHRELQIQWHEDMLHHLRTGEPMPVWEYRLKNGDGEWKICHDPHFSEKYEYRRKRKPRTVTYWHCVVLFEGLKTEVITGYCEDEVIDKNKRCKEAYPDAKFSPIIETTVEMED